jgi:hypothetical protein
MVLAVVVYVLYVKKRIPNGLEEVFLFPFNIFFYLKNHYYGVSCGIVVTGILDMRPGKHDLHFLVGVELLPHASVNIPNETIYIGVFLFIFIIYFIFIVITLFL